MKPTKPKNSPYYHYDFMIDGVRYAKSTKTADKALATKIMFEARRIALLPKNNRPTISLDAAAVLYADKAQHLPSWKNSTKTNLRTMIAMLGGSKLLSEITQRDLMLAVAKRRHGRANSSVNRMLNDWRSCWNHAKGARHDVGEEPDWGKLMLDTPEVAPRILSPVEEARLLQHIRADLADFARFALASGWRLIECVNLTWREVDLVERVARVKIKGGNTLERPLSAAMFALIASQPRTGFHVFTAVAQAKRSKHTATDGRKRAQRIKGERYALSKNGWRKPWVAALKAAGIDAFRFHDLRHTRATRMLKATDNLVLVQKALAHRSLKTTLRYAHALVDDVRAGLDASEISPVLRDFHKVGISKDSANG